MPENKSNPTSLNAQGIISLGELEILKELLQKKSHLSFEVLTDSMTPLIKPGNIIEVQTLSTELKMFDIVAFWDSGKIKCHYIYHLNQFQNNKGEKTIVTRGLLLGYEDYPIPISMILGRVDNFKINFPSKLLIYLRKWRQR